MFDCQCSLTCLEISFLLIASRSLFLSDVVAVSNMKGLEMNQNRKLKFLQLLALVPALVVMYLVLHYQVQLDPLLRVVNNFGTFLHESGHSVFALLTGGSLHEILIKQDGGGHAMTSGGNMFFVLPAGYLATTLVTALMFWINNRTPWGEVVPLFMGVTFLFLTVFYGANVTGGNKTAVVGYLCGSFMLYLGLHPTIRIPKTTIRIPCPEWFWMFVVNLIALYYALGGILSLQYIAHNSVSGNGDDITRFADAYVSWAQPSQVAWFFCWLSVLVWVVVVADCIRALLKTKK